MDSARAGRIALCNIDHYSPRASASHIALQKPRKNSGTTAEPAQWSVHMMRSKLTHLGSVEARDKAEAMDKAMRQLDIREADRFRVSVRRE